MEITLKKLVKCVTRKGREALYREALEKELNYEKILEIATAVTKRGINAGINRVPQNKRGTLHTCAMKLHDATGTLLKVTDPTSPGGCLVDDEEATEMSNAVRMLAYNVFTPDTVSALHNKIVEKLP